MAAAESYPDDLRYHPEHDWARIEGDEATFGITWFAQDALGELVHFEAPEEGATLSEGPAVRRGRVGEGGLRRDRAALGRGARGQPARSPDAPETVNDDPYGAGWLVRVRLTEPGRGSTSLLDAGGVQAAPGRAGLSYLALTDADREAMLEAIGVSSIEELFADLPAGRPASGASSTSRRR